jgi:hypothetical protein
MPLSDASGAITTSAVEQNFFVVNDGTVPHGHETIIYADALLSGDQIKIRVYLYDTNDAAFKIYKVSLIDGPLNITDAESAIVVNWLTSRQYKVSVQRITGTDREISWVRNDI